MEDQELSKPRGSASHAHMQACTEITHKSGCCPHLGTPGGNLKLQGILHDAPRAASVVLAERSPVPAELDSLSELPSNNADYKSCQSRIM